MFGFLANLLPFLAKEERQLPPVVPTDEIIPVHLFDDSSATRGIVLVWTFRFHDVLDPEKLHDALSKLFQMEGWRKFSGRFRYRPDGELEIHVPERDTPERPAVQFTREDHNTPLSEHRLASKMPRPAAGKVTTYPGPKEFCFLGVGPETPRNMDDYVYNGKPQFCLHVQTFTDGTLVSLTHSHVTTDLMGLSAVLEAWSLVLAGKPEAVVPLVGYKEDPFEKMWHPAPKEPHVLKDKVLGGWGMKYWGLRTMFETWRGPEVETRTLCLPRTVMDAMMREARGHLEDTKAEGGKPAFISEGDVLTAVACRILARYQGEGSTRELATIMAVDPRSRAKSVFRPDAAYVQNSPTNVYFFCRANRAVELSLGQLALEVRKTIVQQTSEEQLKAAAKLSVGTMKEGKMPVIFGDKDMATQFMSNWTKGNLAEKMDFGPAVVRAGDDDKEEVEAKRGHPVYFQASDPGHNTVSVISSVYVVMAKDYEGNSWLSIGLPVTVWEDLLDYLGKFA